MADDNPFLAAFIARYGRLPSATEMEDLVGGDPPGLENLPRRFLPSPLRRKRTVSAAERERLRALRQKYGLGEYRKPGTPKPRPRTPPKGAQKRKSRTSARQRYNRAILRRFRLRA